MTPSDRRSVPWIRGSNGGRAIGALLLALIAVARTAAGQEPEVTEPTEPQDVRPPVTATFQPERLDLGVSLFDGYDFTSVNDARGIITEPLLQQNAGFTGVERFTLVLTKQPGPYVRRGRRFGAPLLFERAFGASR